MQSVTALAPQAPAQDPGGGIRMSLHAMREPTCEVWETPVTSIASVLLFGSDGAAENVLSQADADWIADTLDAMAVTYTPRPWPGPTSNTCDFSWPAEYGLEWNCTGSPSHVSGHKAHDSSGDVIATHALEEAVAS